MWYQEILLEIHWLVQNKVNKGPSMWHPKFLSYEIVQIQIWTQSRPKFDYDWGKIMIVVRELYGLKIHRE